MDKPGRNDIAGALAYIRAAVDEDGYLDPDDAEQLIMLQDDPAEYQRQVSALLRELGDPKPPERPRGPMLTYTPKR